MGGQIIDASIVAVPKQRQQPRGERADKGGRDAGRLGADKPAKRRQKDVEARWTSIVTANHYGYKNAVNVDRRHNSGAALSCERRGGARSQVLDDILDGDNTALGVSRTALTARRRSRRSLKEKGLHGAGSIARAAATSR